jgi:hypothetical protein
MSPGAVAASTWPAADEADSYAPYGRGPGAYDRMSHEIQSQIGVVADALRPPSI